MSYEKHTWVNNEAITASKMNNIERGVESVNSEYTPTTWVEGDTVTAAKLNNIEQGIADASGGSSGSSDFSTATITVNITEDTYLDLYCPLLSQDGTSSVSDMVWYDSGTYTCTAILYKGIALVAFDYNGNPEISDGVKYDSDEDMYYIDGDGTITLTTGGGSD